MAGDRYIADLAFAYVPKEGQTWGGIWGHIQRGIHRQIFRSFTQMFCLACYRLVKSFFLENNSFNCCGESLHEC